MSVASQSHLSNSDHYEEDWQLYSHGCVTQQPSVWRPSRDGCVAYLGVQLLRGVNRVAFLLGENLCHGDRQGVADHCDEEGVQKHVWYQLEVGHGGVREPGSREREFP